MPLISLSRYATGFVPATFYDTADFIALNSGKAAEVRFVEGGNMAIAAGLVTDADGRSEWRVPFSAPFSMPAKLMLPEDAPTDPEALAAELCRLTDGAPLRVVGPPPVHPGAQAWAEALQRQGLIRTDNINFHYPLERLADPAAFMTQMARRNLRISQRSQFRLCDNADPVAVYSFIADHHRALGYHMAMTCRQVLDTARIIPVDFFTFMLEGDEEQKETLAGAAIFYRMPGNIVQLINWGDSLALRSLRTSYAFIFAIFRYYADRGFTTVNLGPASTDGIPNPGLVAYKSGLGAIDTPIPTFTRP